MRGVGCGVLLAALWVSSLLAAAPAEKTTRRYFVHVPLPSLERVADLSASGFDIAGVNRRDLTAGVVATDDDLRRLSDLGYSYWVESSNQDDYGILALQDYTDPVEMSAFIDQIVAAYPGIARKLTLAGPFFEGHSQYAVHITKDVAVANDRPTFVLDSQHHAREVMTPEIARDMIEYLATRYDTDPAVRRWVDHINIYVVPIANPDGAMHVFQGDNMWRKNRRPSCPVDLNRNYPFLWGTCNGSSGVCTDDTFRGYEAASEPETGGMLQLADSTHAFMALSYHTYGEYIMYSYGCTNPDEMAAMDEVARALNAILQDDNGQTNQYTVGPIWSAIYRVDGGSVDSWYAQSGTYAFTIEANCCSFQPDHATWRDVTVQRQRTAWQFFLNRTLDGPQIRGRITDLVTGNPIPARVQVDEVTFTHGESPRYAAPNGYYYWLARSGQTYHLTYSMPGYCTATRVVSVGTGPATQDVALVPPTPPTGVTAVGNGDNRIDVSWVPAVDATQYRVLRSLTSGGPYDEIGTVAAPTTTFQDTTVSGGVPYYYVVRAMQPCDSGNSTEAAGITTGACFVGPAFGGLASAVNAAGTTCSVDLTWAPATARCGGRITYRVHRSASAPFVPGPDNLIASGLETTGFTDHDALADSATYHYMVRAVDSAVGGDDGNTVVRSATPTGPTVAGTWTDDAGDGAPAKMNPSAPWSVQATGGKTAPKVYATGTYSDNLCAALTSPALSIQAGSVLSFASKYDIEKDWDAGIVEVSEGPNFASWSRLTTINYPDALLNTGNACGFPVSFAGTVFSRNSASPTYPGASYSGSLSAYAGKDIKLRWRIGSDSTGTGKGWWVDDIAVTNAVFRQVCTAGVASNPKEAGGETAPMVAARASSGTGVELEFGPACGALNAVAYWGSSPIVGAPSWSQAACALGNTGRASFDPGDPSPGEFFYFVLVGQSATKEGSYGQGRDGGGRPERPEAIAVGVCDKPQDLSGVCP